MALIMLYKGKVYPPLLVPNNLGIFTLNSTSTTANHNFWIHRMIRSQAVVSTQSTGGNPHVTGMSLLLSLLAFITFLFPVSSSDVVELTDANFWEKTKDGTWAIEIYATWCGHCQKLAPTWEEVATELKGRVNVAKIESSNEGMTNVLAFSLSPLQKL
eukprot:TRINITY_DN3033_c0_g2_i4.p1 TRINITY_DN3033_c0_g2~~TRINITY_DN3033_c0_g2_i4.p1  ORF type:complete len:158 (-),score=24.16 TRINITY_DN3033_c0_g2_i4:938-1411(-)